MGLQIATSATSATEAAPTTTPDGPSAGSGELIARDSVQPTGPVVPLLRLNYELPVALGPNIPKVGGSPFSALLPETEEVPTCKHCRGPKDLVPPTNFWYACRSCNPETFGA